MNITQELLNLAEALSIAVDSDFMAREHAANIWKQVLKVSNLDLPKKKGGENGTIKED